VLILTASFGSGHRSAADAIEGRIRADHNESVEVRTIDFFKEFAPALNSLVRTLYDGSVQAAPELYRLFFDLTDRNSDRAPVRDFGQSGFPQALEYIADYRPDAVISTFPLSLSFLSYADEGDRITSALVVTDYGVHRQWFRPETCLTFVANEELRHVLIEMGMDKDRVVASGIPVKDVFMQPIEKAEALGSLGLEDRFTVLLTMSAGSTSDQRDIADSLLKEGLQVVAVTGRAKRLHSRLTALRRRRSRLHVYGFTREMHRMMYGADLLVGKAGGITVSECLVVGLPVIANNPVPGQELFNADFLVNQGAGFLARDEADVAAKVAFLVRHPRRLAQMSENARALARPDAARVVVERVLAAVEEGR
jgi:processive 1,2-diacylglycerol beta-glucosyltransferase